MGRLKHGLAALSFMKKEAGYGTSLAADEEVEMDPDALIPRVKYLDEAKWTLEGHRGPVWSCCFSPCGKLCATGGQGGMIKVRR
eukprot:7861491-Pyramimonas_sp.AAC.1